MAEITNTKRIAKNTLMLYFRQILILVVALYTVRIVLNVLGVEDYGIYNVVGGIVSFFSFLSKTMASATQRFFAYAIGENNQDKLNRTFSVNIVIYLMISIIAVILLETLGLWFVHNKLNVPDNRFEAACIIYHFSVATFIFTIFTSPFMAIIIAHEDMQIYAYVSIIEVIMKLIVVFVLKLVILDKLVLYGVLLFFVGVVTAIIYIVVCVIKYEECQFKKFFWDKKQFKDTVGFTGWTMFGQLSTVGRTQAVTILINQFFNPIVVSARAIATQVTNHINVFSNGFNTGLYPPIIKAYAAKDNESMLKLTFTGCKISFFLMWIFSLPLFLEMDYVLTLWLRIPPENAVFYTRLALVESLITAISLPLTTAARAPGKMKGYELSLGSIQILIFVCDYILFKFYTVPAYFVFIVAIIGNLIMFFVRLVNLRILIKFPIVTYLRKVIIPVIFVIIISGSLSFFVSCVMKKTFCWVLCSILITVFIIILTMFFIGTVKEERIIILDKIRKKIG